MSRLDNLMGIHEKAIWYRTQRAEILTSNLANADTPGFRPKDIDFASVLKNEKLSTAATLSVTHHSHIAQKVNPSDKNIYFRDSTDESLDENTVDSDFEKAEFAENAIRYQASVQFLNSRINGLIRAIRGE